MRLIGVVNLILLGVILLVSALFLLSPKEPECVFSIPLPDHKELPKSPFAETDDFFQDIGEGLLALTWVPPQMQLPDLRQELLFYGKNARPDSIAGKATMHFCLKGSQERALVRESERTYLVYQGNYSPLGTKKEAIRELVTTSARPLWGDMSASDAAEEKSFYVFSPDNQPTPLWFEVKSLSDQLVEVRVSMLDEKGALVLSPATFRTFNLQLQDFPKTQTVGWDLGGYRVDTTLLVRQKARWIGKDLFLELHGGDEFAHVKGKERIDFQDGPTPYCCFVAVGDFLIWKSGRWITARNFEESQHLPLMIVKKIEEKIMSLELWDAEGKGKILLSVIRTKDHDGMPSLAQEFKFVGAKTWAKFIIECKNGERMTLKPHDWLVLSQDGWKKLDSPDQIDAYVDQILVGPLFILDKMTKQNGRQALVGHLFNTSRTEMEEVELITSTPTPLANYYRHIPIVPPIQPKVIAGKEEGEE